MLLKHVTSRLFFCLITLMKVVAIHGLEIRHQRSYWFVLENSNGDQNLITSPFVVEELYQRSPRKDQWKSLVKVAIVHELSCICQRKI